MVKPKLRFGVKTLKILTNPHDVPSVQKQFRPILLIVTTSSAILHLLMLWISQSDSPFRSIINRIPVKTSITGITIKP